MLHIRQKGLQQREENNFIPTGIKIEKCPVETYNVPNKNIANSYKNIKNGTSLQFHSGLKIVAIKQEYNDHNDQDNNDEAANCIDRKKQ